MEPRLQAKLLRALQEGEIDRVGGGKPVKVDIRVIATSNRNLTKEVETGRFREDLYFRLNVVQLKMPPLRDRPSDIEKLSDFFARKYSKANSVTHRPIDGEALIMLQGHNWRGNVRELENAIHRAVLLATGSVLDSAAFMLEGMPGVDLAAPSRLAGVTSATSSAASGANTGAGDLVGMTVAEVERDLIIDTLSHCLGNRTHAANILGISIRTLRNKLKQYTGDGVSVPQPRENGRAIA